MQNVIHIFIPVGGSTPLKNMKVSWDDDIPNIWKHKNHVPNHQPVMFGRQWDLIGTSHEYGIQWEFTRVQVNIGHYCKASWNIPGILYLACSNAIFFIRLGSDTIKYPTMELIVPVNRNN